MYSKKMFFVKILRLMNRTFLFSAIYTGHIQTGHWLPNTQFVMTSTVFLWLTTASLWNVCVVCVSVALIHIETDVEAQRVGLWRVEGTLKHKPLISLAEARGAPVDEVILPPLLFIIFLSRHLSLSSLPLILITLSSLFLLSTSLYIFLLSSPYVWSFSLSFLCLRLCWILQALY
jgi:hypothetical protein